MLRYEKTEEEEISNIKRPMSNVKGKRDKEDGRRRGMQNAEFKRRRKSVAVPAMAKQFLRGRPVFVFDYAEAGGITDNFRGDKNGGNHNKL